MDCLNVYAANIAIIIEIKPSTLIKNIIIKTL